MAAPRHNCTLGMKQSFIKQLRAEYRDGVHDPYDPTHLWYCFQMYWNFLYEYADPKLTECTSRQWEAYRMSIMESETADWRTRRGGKSLSFSVIGPFFALIEFGLYEGFVLYRAPYGDQLKQFTKWLRKNPFCLHIALHGRNEADILMSPSMDVNKYSEATSASLGASVALLDEEKKIENGSALEDYAMETRGILIEGDPRAKRIIHKSTGGAMTYWETVINKLRDKEAEIGRPLIIRIPWQECSWITAESIEDERRGFLNAPWYIPQEYECLNVPRLGQFFEQDHLHILGKEHDYPLDYFERKHITVKHGGLDWNGSMVGHILILGRWDIANRILYLFSEEKLLLTTEVSNRIKTLRDKGVTVEVEGMPKSDGYNAGFAQNLAESNCPALFQHWDHALKQVRLAYLQSCKIICHPDCEWFITNYKEATFDEKSLLPTLLKTDSQHGLDACLHLLHEGDGQVDFVQTIPTSRNPFEDVNRQWAIDPQ